MKNNKLIALKFWVESSVIGIVSLL